MKTVQGSIDLIILRTFASMGPQHAYSFAARLLQGSGNAYSINLCPARLRLEQQNRVTATWGAIINGRQPMFYASTPSGREALDAVTRRGRQFARTMENLLAEEA